MEVIRQRLTTCVFDGNSKAMVSCVYVGGVSSMKPLNVLRVLYS